MSLPLRYALRYDPVFIELGRRWARGGWGQLGGVSLYGAVPQNDDFHEIIAFLYLFFGEPTNSVCLIQGSLAEITLMYGGKFATHATVTAVPRGFDSSFPGTLCGSASFGAGLAEFRWGTERFLAFSPEEGVSLRLALPEGDGALYRGRELSAERRLVTVDMEQAADRFARALVAQAAARRP